MPEEIAGPRTDAWQRHDLLHVAPRAWTAALAAHSLGDVPLLPQWADRGWPVIVRRRLEGETPAVVPVGVPLPLAAGKSRIALNVPLAAVIARAAPTSLRTVAHKAEPAWQPTIAALVALGAGLFSPKASPRTGASCTRLSTRMALLRSSSRQWMACAPSTRVRCQAVSACNDHRTSAHRDVPGSCRPAR